ncbi:hypothetical protein LTR27_006144 [Elasticomyces elasticus]|nr:hypothetical protein LTR27_006144 [Elasticomyces elasticus]
MALTPKTGKVWPADTLTAMVSPDSSPSRFFDLPRELRNQIYRELTYNKHSDLQIPYKPRFELTGFRLPEVRLVSKQIWHEYDDEVLRTAVLVVHEPCMASSWGSDETLASSRHTGPIRLLKIVRNVTLQYSVLFTDPGPGQTRPTKDIQGAVDGITSFTEELAQDVLPKSVLRAELTLDVTSIDILKKEKWDAQSFFNMASSANVRSDIRLSPHLFIKHSMFSAHPDLQELDDLAEYMDHCAENRIIYEAKPSTIEDNWHGLELTTFAAGTWDYESIVAEAKLFRSNDLTQEDYVTEYNSSDGEYYGGDNYCREYEDYEPEND